MIEQSELSLEALDIMLGTLPQTQAFTEKELEILKHHFGLEGRNRKTPREIARLYKMPLKKAESEIKRLDTKVFNLLKVR